MLLNDLFAAFARRRRERYAARPDLRRRLRRPVISIGNLAVGGRGKTPMAAAVARLLLEMGERPAILSRGYGRSRAVDGVVIVRDPSRIRSDVDRSGDEPFMLARQLDGVSVLSCPDRYLAGCLAERQLGATLHILDDGFQHLQLERDIDILMIGREDIERPVTLPGGRLREPLDTLIAADLICAVDEGMTIDTRGADIPVFRVRRTLGKPDPLPATTGVLAVAGIARPQPFFDALRANGWDLKGTLVFRDHHRYGPGDVRRIAEAARAAGAAAVLTTEKDFVRLEPLGPHPVPIAWVPLTMEPDRLPEFRHWLAASVGAVRDIILG